MSKRSRYTGPSPETQAEALKIAKGTQKPGQTKEQTKLIAQGIQKGIDHYKKQQRAKARDLDRQLKRAGERSGGTAPGNGRGAETETKIVYRQSLLPWVLLAISWFGFMLLLALLVSDVPIPFISG